MYGGVTTINGFNERYADMWSLNFTQLQFINPIVYNGSLSMNFL